jgi:hypothetical protein
MSCAHYQLVHSTSQNVGWSSSHAYRRSSHDVQRQGSDSRDSLESQHAPDETNLLKAGTPPFEAIAKVATSSHRNIGYRYMDLC